MADRMNKHRAQRLREYLDYLAPGDSEEARRLFMQRTKVSKGRVSQMLQGFGERAGVNAAESLRLRDHRWFDRPLGTPVHAAPLEMNGEETRREPPDLREAVLLLRHRAQGVSSSDRKAAAALLMSFVGDDDASETQLDAICQFLGGGGPRRRQTIGDGVGGDYEIIDPQDKGKRGAK